MSTFPNAWRLGLYGSERDQTGITDVEIGCDLSVAEMAQLPVGTTVQMTIIAKRREVFER